MTRRRKRPANTSAVTELPSKRVKDDHQASTDGSTHHPVLSLYYPRVVTLRTYLRNQLPASSRSRRKKVASIGLETKNGLHHPTPLCSTPTVATQPTGTRVQQANEEIQILADVLDSTLVGVLKEPDCAVTSNRRKEFAAYTQSQVRSSLECTDIGATTSQSDIVDFAILSLFKRFHGHSSFYRPPHLLCHGFQRATDKCHPNHEHAPMAGIPGIVPQYPNKNVSMLKNSPWTDILNLLGKNCEEIMLHLLLDCGVFVQVDRKKGTFYQLSGIQLSELKTIDSGPANNIAKSPIGHATRDTSKPADDVLNTPANIIFVRSRMLYARAALNAKGKVRFGLRHIHVLNRYPDSTNWDHTIHIMKYIFPRQFGLHNVFTSYVNSKETVQPFKDYTLREEEIARCRNQHANKAPRRLRGELVPLIQKLQKRHHHCSYAELLRYYCPIESTHPQKLGLDSPPSSKGSNGSTKPNTRRIPMTDCATPSSSVSAFCRAVLLKLIPNELYGCGEDGTKNRDIIMRHVDTFVQLRRFESLSLHEVAQGLKITCVRWLQPPSELPSAKLSASDIRKRTEMFLEFVYYIFDSLLIPLIRSNFYVTESSVHRNRLFYFRHDVWRRLAEPLIAQLKLSTFQEVKRNSAEDTGRSLGFSLLRLLPKKSGARPIVNLRRRPVRRCGWGNELGPSINSLMTPVFNVLKYEKSQRLDMLGATMFSVRDIYPRLKTFKERKAATKPFYFVKLDIQSCFDTIPQQRLLTLVERLVPEEEYVVTRHAEVRPPDEPQTFSGRHASKIKPVRKFISNAAGFADIANLYDAVIDDEIRGKRHTVFVNTSTRKKYQRKNILNLLRENTGNNLVKIGKKYFRQKTGIPQGSIVSTLLCNFFYSEFERERLAFLDGSDDALLLRLVDDYLLITTEPGLAAEFLQVMLDVQGNEDYGISVNPDKILVNFTATNDGNIVPRLEPSQHQFPYCGTLIDTHTLSITKDRTRDPSLTTSDTLTVEANKSPGLSFYRKALSSFKIQTHTMFLDTKHNSVSVVLASLYQSFFESALKLYEYSRCLSHRGRGLTSPTLLIRTISALMDVAIGTIQSRTAGQMGFESSVTGAQVRWLAATAFRAVFGRKQSRFPGVVRWLDGVVRGSRPKRDGEAVRLRRAVSTGVYR
ncbi:hypothetical protein AJ79_06801 [Helicocarpus griseus UAMH5409]|uniref:Telomerase reverse transcriptase n=1 Tax=Helicocarpus griseus UAMH5409 TaxID=1447875 RepID=A0A2B7X1J7_9EURO|nr:hypothetical protein AJ79_06801 [Helicocarpus griseus UAMH5409]